MNWTENKVSYVANLYKKGLIKPPSFVVGGIQYETIMGSEAYGVSSGGSDCDVYGFCIPPKDTVFPHLAGEIEGFGRQKKRFNQWQQHHVLDKEAKKEFDFSIYNIVKYFQLTMENNPNMVDSLFTPQRCVLHATKIANMVRDRRKIFLHKGCWHKFKGYAFSQMKKMKSKTREGKRANEVEEFGYDRKFAYHTVRLLDEVEQILTVGDIDLTRDRERLKSIRRGEWSIEKIEEHFSSKEKFLEELYEKSKLPWGPDEEQIKQLLLDCLEEFYGDLSSSVVQPDRAIVALRKIRDEIENVRGLM